MPFSFCAFFSFFGIEKIIKPDRNFWFQPQSFHRVDEISKVCTDKFYNHVNIRWASFNAVKVNGNFPGTYIFYFFKVENNFLKGLIVCPCRQAG